LESGKPESWLILSAEPGAGIYLGFSKAFAKAELFSILADPLRTSELKDLLQFVPVAENDYFEIAPGVPHAIGAGVTLVEPQRVAPGKSGQTFRLWDWDRRYDEKGQLDPIKGKARELHVAQCKHLVDPMQQCGLDFVSKLRRSPRKIAVTKH